MLPYNRRESVVLGIGSLLDRSRSNFSVWGSGYMNNFERAEGGTLHAVRGRFSAEKLMKEGFPYCSVWGDPGLLLPRVYCPKRINIIRWVLYLILKTMIILKINIEAIKI